MEFDDAEDYAATEQNDVVRLENLHGALRSGTQITARIGEREVALHHRLSERQVEMVLAGGRIPQTAEAI